MMKPQVPDPRLAQLTDEDYRRLHPALMLFFRSHGSEMPEDHVSETIVRILESIARGVDIEDLPAYAHGAAKHVLQQHRRETAPVMIDRPDPTATSREHLLCILEKCKKECLSPQERNLINHYYAAPKGDAKIASHRALASKLDITGEALRIRAHRIRRKLAACVRDHLS